VSRGLLAAAGAAAGVTAVSSCFPMDVVRTRLMVTGGMVKYGGMRACIATMYTKQVISPSMFPSLYTRHYAPVLYGTQS
jgi:solute carrier family 25 phosphate transporter 23/24/25/41